MRISIGNIWQKVAKFLHFSQPSLAAKCRMAFGAAIVLILILALLPPYIWMDQLTKNVYLDTGRAETQALQNRHFQLKETGPAALPMLDAAGAIADANSSGVRWIKFSKDSDQQLQQLSHSQRSLVKHLRRDDEKIDDIAFQLVKFNSISCCNVFHVLLKKL